MTRIEHCDSYWYCTGTLKVGEPCLLIADGYEAECYVTCQDGDDFELLTPSGITVIVTNWQDRVASDRVSVDLYAFN